MAKNDNRVTLQTLMKKVVNLGYVGENLHSRLIIDCSTLLYDYPQAEVLLKVRYPGDETISEPEIVLSGDNVIWTLTSQELTRQGDGQYQLTFTSGNEVIRSGIGFFHINASLLHT